MNLELLDLERIIVMAQKFKNKTKLSQTFIQINENGL